MNPIKTKKYLYLALGFFAIAVVFYLLLTLHNQGISPQRQYLGGGGSFSDRVQFSPAPDKATVVYMAIYSFSLVISGIWFVIFVALTIINFIRNKNVTTNAKPTSKT